MIQTMSHVYNMVYSMHTWYTLYAYFVSDFYIFWLPTFKMGPGQGYRPGILVYFYVKLGALIVRKFRARAQKVNF